MRESAALPKRFYGLDSLRFVGAALIVLAHFLIYADAGWTATLMGGVFPLVDFFFILSGFVMMHAYHDGFRNSGDFKRFMQNRIARVYPLHLLMLMPFLCLGGLHWSGLVKAADATKYDPAAIVPNLLLIQAWGTTSGLTFNYPAWSVSAELLAYLVFPLAIFLARSAGVLGLVAMIAAMFVGLEFMQNARAMGPWPEATYDFGCLRALPGFFSGVAAFLIIKRYRFALKSFAPALVVLTMSIAVMLWRADPRLSILLGVAVVILFAAAEVGGAKSWFIHPLMVRFGDASYAIYMVHPLIGTLLIGFVGRRVLGLEGSVLVAWALLVAMPIVYVIAPLIYDHFERPARKWVASLELPRFQFFKHWRANVFADQQETRPTA